MNHELTSRPRCPSRCSAIRSTRALSCPSSSLDRRRPQSLSGERAYDLVYNDKHPHRPCCRQPTTRLGRSRSPARARSQAQRKASTATFTSSNEEEGTPANTFDFTLGGLAVAITGKESLHAAEARALRLGEHARPAEQGREDGNHGPGGRAVCPPSRRARTASCTCTSARRCAAPEPEFSGATAWTTAISTSSHPRNPAQFERGRFRERDDRG